MSIAPISYCSRCGRRDPIHRPGCDGAERPLVRGFKEDEFFRTISRLIGSLPQCGFSGCTAFATLHRRDSFELARCDDHVPNPIEYPIPYPWTDSIRDLKRMGYR